MVTKSCYLGGMKCPTKAIKLLHEKDYDSYRIDSETITILFFRTTCNFFNFYSNESLKEWFYDVFFFHCMEIYIFLISVP